MVMLNTETLTSEQATSIVKALIDDQDHSELVWSLLGEHGECIWVANDGNCEVEFGSADSAEEAAQEYVEDGDWGDSKGFVDAQAWERRTLGNLTMDGDSEFFTIPIKVKELTCTNDEHEWTSPHEVLGGLVENPGVWGNGGGVIIQEICKHCGSLKTTDTWAQHGGIQGLTAVTYAEPGSHAYSDAYDEWKEKTTNENI